MKPKRAKPFAANLASTKMLEAEGWTVGTVEQRIPHTFITRDLFGFLDLMAMAPSRVAKIRLEARAGIWLASGGRIQVHDWVKVKGQKARHCKILEITKENNQ